MTTRLVLTLLILTILRLGHGHTVVAAETTAPRPHIVIFVIDDLGYADVGFNGGREIQTPAIDALAAEGTVLAAHYVQPVCSPTRAALMTGRYATRTGVYTIVRPNARWGLPLDERTLADALRQAGYTTAITGKWHLGEFEPAYRPTARGFDHQYGHYFGAIDYYQHNRDGQVDWYRDDKPLSEDGYSTELIAAEASRLITQHKPVADSKPLFLYIPFNGVHAPLQVPDSYLQPYSALKGNRRTYAGMLAAVDAAIGRITTALRDAGMLDNTLVLFTADNGGPSPGTVTSNGALRAGKGTLYEGGVRGCAFVRWPGRIPAGTRSEEPVHVIDWFPTLVRFAGGQMEQPKPLDGQDLSQPERPYLYREFPGYGGQQSIRRGDWKLVRQQLTKNRTTPELYNLREDPGETTDVAANHPQLVEQLSQLIQQERTPSQLFPLKPWDSAR